MSLEDIKVGDPVLVVRSQARGRKQEWILPVARVHAKFFFVSAPDGGNWEYKFRKSNGSEVRPSGGFSTVWVDAKRATEEDVKRLDLARRVARYRKDIEAFLASNPGADALNSVASVIAALPKETK